MTIFPVYGNGSFVKKTDIEINRGRICVIAMAVSEMAGEGLSCRKVREFFS